MIPETVTSKKHKRHDSTISDDIISLARHSPYVTKKIPYRSICCSDIALPFSSRHTKHKKLVSKAKSGSISHEDERISQNITNPSHQHGQF
mmetsp:Transcript_3845/g.8265  ORF Transcript_3845/g.8265 Transcript_3845/m.8265 type:complete len:91 (-) Transcript_3845:128-400(-)